MTDGLQVATPAASASLAIRTEARRVAETVDRSAAQRSALGQFFTPAPIASLLAGMFEPPEGPARVLDPGAGVGSLTAALVDRAVVEGWAGGLDVTAVEVDRELLGALTETLRECAQVSPSITARTVPADFVEWACHRLDGGLFAPQDEGFDLAILNPPYQKLATSSAVRRMLSRAGIEVTNLYAAFVSLALGLLNPGGQLVAITPRSFCNGPYFRAFRRELLKNSALRRIHLFEARDKAFRDTGVLQENVVVHLVKGAPQAAVIISTSPGSGEEDVHEERVPCAHVVRPDDPDACDGAGLPLDLAWGIAAYLNTTAVDMFFRQFNGHTQVNATDLRSLNYPTMGQLEKLGGAARETEHTQVAIDALFDRCLPAPAEDR